MGRRHSRELVRAGALLATIAAADAGLRRRPSLAVAAVLDWVAHVATTTAVASPLEPATPHVRVLLGLASVALDVDHVPRYLAKRRPQHDTRPRPHSLLTLGALAAVAAAAPERGRPAARAVLAGTAAHLLRDLGTGPGAPLGWPLTTRSVRIPYAAYLLAVVVARGRTARRRP